MSSSNQLPALDNTLGAAFIGVIVSATLHGVSLLQAWYYYTHQQDKWPLKTLVAAVMTFDTIHQILISHTVYTYTITNYFNPAALTTLVWSLLVEVLFNGLTVFLVQGFLTWRVWLLSGRSIVLTAVVVLLVLLEFGCILAFSILSLNMHTFVELAQLKFLSIMVNAFAAAGDVVIAFALCALLYRSRTGFRRSNTIIKKLMLFAVNTGLVTSLCAVGSLVSIVAAGKTFLYIAFFFCIGRLYTNSLLATLNARDMIRGSSDGIQSTTDNLSLSKYPKAGSITSRRPTGTISIKIDTTKEFVSDHDELRYGDKQETPVSLLHHPSSSTMSPFPEKDDQIMAI